jgi:hypothetical protein
MKARLKTLLLILIGIVLSTHFVEAQETMFGSLIFVDDSTVSAETTLHYSLNLPSERIEEGDYI